MLVLNVLKIIKNEEFSTFDRQKKILMLVSGICRCPYYRLEGLTFLADISIMTQI
jgi:hypothetical protein